MMGASLAHADGGAFANSGGSGSGGAGVSINSNVANPAGTLSLYCPGNGPTTCSGGNLTYNSNDGSTAIEASFTSGSYAESCSGGGKGGHITCGYSLTGYFSGTLTRNGASQAITGVTYQGFTVGGPPSGTTGYNSAYTPFYYSDTEQILRSDDLMGTNQIAFGSFYGAYGLALDSAGRIYVADTYNSRVCRMDDVNLTNLVCFGTYGSGQGQFDNLSGIAVDSSGRIYVYDSSNTRLVRMDDMNGTNWMTYGSAGSGTGQFAAFLTSIALDSSGRIYIADGPNLRIVRIDDMYGTNWTTLTSSPVVNGVSHSFGSPAAVTLDDAGRIYVADNVGPYGYVVRVDDMTGANWTYVNTGNTSGLNSIGVDSGGSVFLAGGGVKIVDALTTTLNSSGSIGPIGTYYVFAVTPIPLPNPHPSAVSLVPNSLSFSQNVGTSGSQTVTLTNFGGSPLHVGTIAASGGFTETNTCGSQVPAGANCTVTVTFQPSATGAATGTLTITDDSGNVGASQGVPLAGVGTAPAASVTPTSVNFQSVVVNTTSSARTVTLQNTGTGPMNVASVSTAAPFADTTTCIGTLAAGNSCTISVTFTPAAPGSASGSLAITDDVGTQNVSLSGTGVAPVTVSPTSLNLGGVAVGSTTSAKSVTLQNRQSVTLSFASIVASSGFSIVSNTCLAGVQAGEACSVGVTFTPTAIGSASGTLTFTDSASNSPQTVALSGTGSAPVTLSTATLSFGSVVAGNTSSSKSVTLTNAQNAALSFTSITVTAGFAIATNTCGSGIAGLASCTVGVTFSPTVVGSVTGTLTFTDSAGNSPQGASLTGTGTAPVTLSATTLSFGTVAVGTTSSAKSVTVTNHLSKSLNFTSISASAGFIISSNTCGTSIAAGANCAIGVKFAPTATGAVNGALTLTDSAVTSPQTVTLTGSGK